MGIVTGPETMRVFLNVYIGTMTNLHVLYVLLRFVDNKLCEQILHMILAPRGITLVYLNQAFC